MPKPGQKSVTLKKEVYEKAEEKAKQEEKSVAAFVTDLILHNCNRGEEAPQ